MTASNAPQTAADTAMIRLVTELLHYAVDDNTTELNRHIEAVRHRDPEAVAEAIGTMTVILGMFIKANGTISDAHRYIDSILVQAQFEELTANLDGDNHGGSRE
jgi:hypothetical protein